MRDDAILVKELAIIRTLWFPCEEVARVHRGLVDQLQDSQLRAYACSDIPRSVDDIRLAAVSWRLSWTTAAIIFRPSTKGILVDYSKMTIIVWIPDLYIFCIGFFSMIGRRAFSRYYLAGGATRRCEFDSEEVVDALPMPTMPFRTSLSFLSLYLMKVGTSFLFGGLSPGRRPFSPPCLGGRWGRR